MMQNQNGRAVNGAQAAGESHVDDVIAAPNGRATEADTQKVLASILADDEPPAGQDGTALGSDELWELLDDSLSRPASPAGRGQLPQPLLLVAAGGSGREIATQVKAFMIETFDQVPDNVSILALDSADEPIARREQRRGQVVELERESEFIHLARVPLAGIRRMPERHPEIMERLGETLHHIHRASIRDGAAAERPQGLIALLWNARRIMRLLRQRIRQLVGRNADVRLNLHTQSGINVVVLGSTAGGQGSGAMLDLAYMVRHALAELGDLAESSRVIGMFTLPGAFAEIRGANLQPNSYAFFKELDELMQGKGFAARYPGDIEIQSSEPPFDHVYVLDGVDELGKTWPNRDEVCALGARALTLLFGSEVGMREIAGAVNEQGVLRRRSAGGFGTYLGTVGQAILHLPTLYIMQRCVLRQSLAMIDEYLLQPLPAPAADTAAPALLQSTHFQPAALVNALQTNQAGAPFSVQIGLPAGLEQWAAEEVPAQLRTLVNNYQQRRIYGQTFVDMAAAAQRIWGETDAALQHNLTRVMEKGQIPPAMKWLAVLERAWRRLDAQLAQQVSERAEQATQAQLGLESAAAALEQAAESLFIWRKARVRQAATAYMESANAYLRGCVEQRVAELVSEQMQHSLRWVEQKRRGLEQIQTRLLRVRDLLLARQQVLTQRQASRNEISLADELIVARLYAQYAGAPGLDVEQALAQSGGIWSWGQQTPEQLTRLLAQTALPAFLPLQKLNIEEVLRRRWPDRSPLQWIKRLETLAAGAWNLDRSLLTGGGTDLAEFSTIGVPDVAASIFASSGSPIASLHSSERIIALRTLYGASIDMLKPAVQWRQAYERAVGHTPLHIFPHFQRQDEQSVLFFALGLIFELIYNQTSWFYYRPSDKLEAPIRLGQGLDNALREFTARTELSADVRTRVGALVNNQGVVKALAQMEAYVRAGSGKDDETTKMLRRTVRAYAAELGRGQQNGQGDA
ncbi:MAG: tubulin-like doman-containing protein [Caldilineaceae bacterium]